MVIKIASVLTNLRRLFSVLGEVLPKDFHDLRVELGHEDLDGLVRLGVDLPGKVAVQGVQGVEVPAVTDGKLGDLWLIMLQLAVSRIRLHCESFSTPQLLIQKNFRMLGYCETSSTIQQYPII